MNVRIFAAAWAVAAALLATGSVAQSDAGYLKSTENVARIQIGTTTATQVKALLGEPLRISKNSRRAWDVWEYRTISYGQRGSLYVSSSAADGVVREVIQQAEYRFSP